MIEKRSLHQPDLIVMILIRQIRLMFVLIVIAIRMKGCRFSANCDLRKALEDTHVSVVEIRKG